MLLKKIKRKVFFKKIKFLNRFYYSGRRFLNVMRVVYGINYNTAYLVLSSFGFSKNSKLGMLNKRSLRLISDFFVNYLLIERGLRRFRNGLLLDRKVHGCIRGMRLLSGLPINGQRTHTNSKTVRKLFKGYKFQD